MDQFEEYEVETIIAQEEDGSETEYAVLDKFEYEGKNYTILAVVENEEISEDEYLFTYEEEDGEMVISSVEDEEEFNRVSAYYDSLGCED